MPLLRTFFHFILYSNIWIALAAVASAAQTYLLLDGKIDGTLLVFIFSATVFLYALHRLIGLSKVKAYQHVNRFQIIGRLQSSIFLCAAVSALISGITYCLLPAMIQWSMLVPGALSFAYVLPFLSRGKRLRDVHGVKIFMVAVVWAWVGVLLPALEMEQWQKAAVGWMMLEKTLFIFAITLAFDIRDFRVDSATHVKTFPTYLGMKNTKRLAWLLLILMMIVVGINVANGFYHWSTWIALFISAISSGFLVQNAHPNRSDYYYTAILDGTIILQSLLIVAAQLWSGSSNM
ncbi:MAG: hypothetical protein AAGI23_00310 [Bacteroidota bacterium]